VRRTTLTGFAAALALGAATLLAACASGPQSGALVHPEKVESPVICTACHDAEMTSYNHDAGWGRTHGQAAVSNRRACDLCHRPSSCADCHAQKEEIKPSVKRGSRFDAAIPHQGDYLTQHRIDARVDPASCFPCHGRKNEARCRTCHR